jgi:hypothetical protein
MWRGLVTVWVIYGCGHPTLDGYRPAWIDRPLQSFYENVNTTARDGQKVLASIDESRWMRYLKDYVSSMNARLRAPG